MHLGLCLFNVDVSCAELGYATLILLARDLIYVVVFGAGCGLTGRASGELELHVRQWVVCKEDGIVGCAAVGDTAGHCSRVREDGFLGRCDAALGWEGVMQQTLHFICEQRSAADEVSGAVADCGGDKAARCRDAALLLYFSGGSSTRRFFSSISSLVLCIFTKKNVRLESYSCTGISPVAQPYSSRHPSSLSGALTAKPPPSRTLTGPEPNTCKHLDISTAARLQSKARRLGPTHSPKS